MVLAGAVVVGVAGNRWREATTLAVAGFAVAAVAYGLTRRQRFHPREWRRAWAGLGGGLLAVVVSALLAVTGVTGLPTQLGTPMVLTVLGDMAAVVGLVWLLQQRTTGRAAEALAEALVVALALAFVALTLGVVPADGWRPGLELVALAPPLLDVVVLWMVCSLVSLTERHPVSYSYLVAGAGGVFVAHSAFAATTLMHRSRPPEVFTLVLLAGVCLWAVSVAHPSLRRPFDPVPLRPSRPGTAKLAMLVALALVVPSVLSIQSAFGIETREPALVVGSTLLPVLMVLYLLRQVFTHAAAEYRAQHDPLTGVCNRLLFEDRLRMSLGQAGRSSCSVAVMFLDLDRFKGINDSLGHAVGNQLLQSVVKRLQSCLREQDILARFGGDEFTILIPDSDGCDESVTAVAERVLGRFVDPFAVGNRTLSVKASIGVAVSPLRRARRGDSAQARRHRHVPGEGGGQEHLPDFRLRHERPRPPALRVGGGPARCGGVRPPGRALSAQARHRHGDDLRHRGAGPLAAPPAGIHPPVGVHPAGGGVEPGGHAGRVGAGGGLHPGPALAGSRAARRCPWPSTCLPASSHTSASSTS